MQSTFQNSLNALFEELIKSNSAIVNWLQPGISKNNIEEKLQAHRMIFPTEVYDLYAWKNGIQEEKLETRRLGELSMFRLGIFPPFEINLSDYGEFRSAGLWDENFFPVFGSGGGDFYLIDCDKSSRTYGMLHYYSPSAVDYKGIITIYDSLESLISTVVRCYESKIYYFSDSGILNINFDLEIPISKSENPKSEYWKIYQ